MEPKWSSNGAQWSSNGAQMEPNGAKMEPGGAQLELKWSPMELKWSPREDRGCSGCSPLGFGKTPVRNSEVLTGTFSENCVSKTFLDFLLPPPHNLRKSSRRPIVFTRDLCVFCMEPTLKLEPWALFVQRTLVRLA